MESVVEDIRQQRLIREWLQKNVYSATSAPPSIHAEDDASVSVENEVTDESEHVSLDQSNHGISFINLHWASFSTGLSSVLIVVLVGLAIASCCYFRGRRQRQARSRHSQLLHALSSTASHVSTPAKQQSGVYPASLSAGSSVNTAPVHSPVVRYSGLSSGDSPIARVALPSPASCGLPGCATTYERQPSVIRDSPGASGVFPDGYGSGFLPVGYDALKAIAHLPARPSAPFDDGPRKTGISSLIG